MPPPPPSRLRPLRYPQVAERRRGEGPLWLLAGLLLSVVMTWPLARQLRAVVPQSDQDPLAQAWHIAWGGHALRTQPGLLFDANTSWPDAPSLAFADSMLGYAPAALLGSGVSDAVLRYNVLFLFAYALLFAAAGLLGRELGLRLPAAGLVAVAAAFSPTRIAQANHLNVLSVGGIVLTVFLLVSGYRRRRAWQVLGGFLVATWQMSIGFAMGIWFAYLLAVLAVAAAGGWWWTGRPPLRRDLVVSTAAGALVLGLTTLLLLQPYLKVVERYAQAGQRDPANVEHFSPPPRALLAAAPESRLWGERTAPIRSTLSFAPEQSLLPGLLTVALAVYGARWRRMSRAVRASLVGGGGLVLLLSFGFRFEDGLLYDLVFRYAPGWGNLRTPGRLAFLWSLVLALLAGMGAQRLWEALREGPGDVRTRRRLRPAATPVVLLLLAGVLYEGSARLPLVPVPAPPVPLSTLPSPQFHLPSSFGIDARYMLWSTDGFLPLANGAASVDGPTVLLLRSLQGFPDPGSVAVMRERGIRTVVVHRSTAVGTPWEGAADRPVEGLGIGRQDVGSAVLFDLSPNLAPAATASG